MLRKNANNPSDLLETKTYFNYFYVKSPDFRSILFYPAIVSYQENKPEQIKWKLKKTKIIF